MTRSPRIVPLLLALALAGCGPGPEDAFSTFVDTAREGRWEVLYGMLDETSRTALDERLDRLVRAPADSTGERPYAAFADLDRPALFAELADRHPELTRTFDIAGFTLLDSQSTGDQAGLTVELIHDGEVVPAVVRLRREDGAWKVVWP